MNIEKEFCVSVRERTGEEGVAFFRRGFPFAQGKLWDENCFDLIGEDGQRPRIQTAVLEKYEDGSIRWLSVAFSVYLKPWQEYSLCGVFEKRENSDKRVAQKKQDSMLLGNESTQVCIKEQGVCSLLFDGRELVGDDGIGLSIKNESGKHYFHADNVDIYINGEVYGVIRLTGRFGETEVYADWFITLYHNADRLHHSVKFNSKGSNILYSEAVEFDFAEGMRERVYAHRAEQEDGKVLSDWFGVKAEDGLGVVMASKDVARFCKVTAPVGVHSGFVMEDKKVLFSPIQYDLPFEWPDGVSRTVHLDMAYTNTEDVEQLAVKESKWAFEPPVLVIPSEWFVKVGAIDYDSKSEAIDRIERLMTSLYKANWNHFDAGMLPHTVVPDYVTEKACYIDEDYHRSAGETLYMFWRSYMNSANSTMYDMVMELAEHWTDVMMYQGKHRDLRGSNRYVSGFYFNDHMNFCNNMPYYGDLSGLYLTYCMTGDPYYEENFKQGAEFWVESIRRNGVPILSYWWDTLFAVHSSLEFQYRCCAQTRGLYFAYKLYGDERYKKAAESITAWLEEAQNPNGSFYEVYYYDTKKPMYAEVYNLDGGLSISEKHYIMLFGAKGFVDYCRDSGDSVGIGVMKRLADYLITAMEPDGWIWGPNKNNLVHNIGNERGACGVTAAGCIYFFSVLYDITGEQKYFEALLKLLRFYMSLWGCKHGGQLHSEYTAFLHGAQTASRLIKENMDYVIEAGFLDVAALLDSNTRQVYGVYPMHNNRYRRFGVNAYNTVYGRVVTFNHRQSAFHSDTYADKAFDFECLISPENKLWLGGKIYVSPKGINIRREVKVVEIIHLLETCIEITGLKQEAAMEVTKYTRCEIEIKVTGKCDFGVSIKDGFFAVKEGECYDMILNGDVQEVIAKNGVLQWNVFAVEKEESIIHIEKR